MSGLPNVFATLPTGQNPLDLFDENFDYLESQIVNLQQQGSRVATSISFLDKDSDFNQFYKNAGTLVYDLTTAKPLWASGGLATDAWKDAMSNVIYTPS